MSDKISKYKTELKALTEQNKENERRAKSEQMKQKQLNEGMLNFLKIEPNVRSQYFNFYFSQRKAESNEKAES